MKVFNLKIDDIHPYENNPRFNDKAVEKVSKSIEQFGFRNPIIVDKNKVIIAGHTRYKACLQLGIKEVPVIIAEDLTEDEVKAYRIADNKVSEFASWDYDLLRLETEGLDLFTGFDLDELNIDWSNVDDLDHDNYEQPEKEMLKCPHCGHIDSTVHFQKVNKKYEDIS